jgi:hypothetical protein
MDKNKDKKYFHIRETEIPLYRGKLVAIITNDRDQVVEHIPSFEDDEIYGHTVLTNWNGCLGICVILNFDNPFRVLTHGVVAHEIVHFSSALCGEIGIDASHDNDEAFAYLAEWATDQIYGLIKKTGMVPAASG